ncbi:unnamed protein product [Owenia fusiformis]|uniref:Uncharacterized protein n=1 Tax=Owenia fusiformis TaxID=6347 RepID=A0A8J1U1Y5_OWEFU|nr:unnamed protein product [Owenia fusiformis]
MDVLIFGVLVATTLCMCGATGVDQEDGYANDDKLLDLLEEIELRRLMSKFKGKVGFKKIHQNDQGRADQGAGSGKYYGPVGNRRPPKLPKFAMQDDPLQGTNKYRPKSPSSYRPIGKQKTGSPKVSQADKAPNIPYSPECSVYKNKYKLMEDKNPCFFRECKGSKFSDPIRCRDGLGVPDEVLNEVFPPKYPCTKPMKECKATLSDKGVTNVNVDVCGIDLIWVVDISCSISNADKLKVKNFILAATKQLPVRPPFTQVGALAFSEKAYHILYMNSYNNKNKVLKALSIMPLTPDKCATATYEALYETRVTYLSKSRGNRPDKPDIVVVLTDGKTHPPEKAPETILRAKELKATGAQVFVLSLPNIKTLPGTDEWRAIASSEKNIYTLDSFDALKGMIKEITRKACSVL